MGRTWLRTPVLWETSHDIPHEAYNYTAMTPTERRLVRARFLDWFRADWDYALTTIYFFCAAIGLYALYQFFALWRSGKPSKTEASRPSIVDKFIAGTRYISSRQFKVTLGSKVFYLQTLGVTVLVSSICIFTMALMLSVRPYYWPNHAMGHSQPIATRSGWMAIAIMPFMIAFATKVNPISFLVHVSHEKLQVFHRWTAVFMYITGLVHTFPFIKLSIQHGEMTETWATSPYYWTGVVALVCQTWLLAMSWSPIRNPFYEFFKKMHFLCATVFMVFLFLHCNFRLSSWHYFWATLAIYCVSWLLRTGRSVIYNSNIAGCSATIQQLPGSFVRVSIDVPSRMKWTPGQHVFVRFMGGGIGFLHTFSSHPFSITSLSDAPPEGSSSSTKKLDLVMKSHNGITKHLHDVSQNKVSLSTRVWVDGPYGGVPIHLGSFDSVYLFAGGSGATMIVPILMNLVNGFGSNQCQFVQLVLAVRTKDSLSWLSDQLSEAQELAKKGGNSSLVLKIHVTGEKNEEDEEDDDDDDDDKQIKKKLPSMLLSHDQGRPNIPSMIHNTIFEEKKAGKIGIVACGPDSLLYDVRNEVAECQLALMDGFTDCKEIFLHTEHYGW